MSELADDTTIPRNIRNSINEAKTKVLSSDSENELAVNVVQAIYLLDDALNDINLPFHVRTDLMGVISDLEALKEKLD